MSPRFLGITLTHPSSWIAAACMTGSCYGGPATVILYLAGRSSVLAAVSISVTDSDLEAEILQNEFVKACIELAEDVTEDSENSSSDPKSVFSRMKFENLSGKFLARVLKYFGCKILSLLYPGGVVYHSGQLDVLARCRRSGSPFLFVNFGKSPWATLVGHFH